MRQRNKPKFLRHRSRPPLESAASARKNTRIHLAMLPDGDIETFSATDPPVRVPALPSLPDSLRRIVHAKRLQRSRCLRRICPAPSYEIVVDDKVSLLAQPGQSRPNGDMALQLTVAPIDAQMPVPKALSDLEQLGALSQIAPVGLVQIDLKWNCLFVNDTWCRLSGLNTEEARDQRWTRALHPDDAEKVLMDLHNALLTQSTYKGEFRLHTPLGDDLWVLCTATPVRSENRGLTYLLILQDITSLHEAQIKLKSLAHYDALTHLANRTLLEERLTRACTRARRGIQIALLFIDLDGFKIINDNYGHKTGDDVLVAFAQRLTSVVREEDTVARPGGDEFIILLENIQSPYDAGLVAETILNILKRPIHLNGESQTLSASIGIALTSATNSAPNHLIRQADDAMYNAKRQGKSTYCYYSSDPDGVMERHFHLARELRAASIEEAFKVSYQPQYNLHTGALVGHEALIRWQRGNGEWVSPSEFIPILEETHLIHDVSTWVMDQAFKTQRQWLDSGRIDAGVQMSINLSPKLFYRDQIIHQIQHYLNLYSLPPEVAIFEITETVLIDERLGHIQKPLNRLKQMGCRLALDDFGTGFSSLSYLKAFPIDQVKIDKSFVADVLDDPSDKAIINAIILLAESLELEVVAEGVERDATSLYLMNKGCFIQQGFLFGSPNGQAAPLVLKAG